MAGATAPAVILSIHFYCPPYLLPGGTIPFMRRYSTI